MANILTERLQIRMWKPEDALAYVRIYGDPEVKKYLLGTGPPLHDIELAKKQIEQGIQFHNLHGYYLWAVEETASGEVIGGCGFLPIDQEPSEVELTFHFAHDWWGKGFASEATRACLDYGRISLNFSRIEAFVHPENIASIRILEKLGFQYEGMDECDRRYVYQ